MGQEVSIRDAFEKWGDDLAGYAAVLVGADDARDVVQQAFVAVLASGRWGSVSDPRAYLFRATLNAARSLRRSDRRRVAREWRTRSEVVAHMQLLTDPAVLAAIGHLSVQQRAVIYLTYWEDLTPAMVAERLGIGEGSVRKQLNRARRTLREVL